MPKADTTNTMPTVDQHGDAILALLAQHQSLISRLTDGESVTEQDEREVMHQCAQIDEQLATSKPTTMAGTLAALERLKYELQEFLVSEGTIESRLCIGLVDGASSFLREQGPS